VDYSDATIAPNGLINNFRCLFLIVFHFVPISRFLRNNYQIK